MQQSTEKSLHLKEKKKKKRGMEKRRTMRRRKKKSKDLGGEGNWEGRKG